MLLKQTSGSDMRSVSAHVVWIVTAIFTPGVDAHFCPRHDQMHTVKAHGSAQRMGGVNTVPT